MVFQRAKPLLNPGTVNVCSLGARGNGQTDDSPAINAAVEVVSSAGGCLYFPAGTYVVRSCINLRRLGAPLVIAGDGISTKIAGGFLGFSDESGGSVFYASGALADVTIRDLCIQSHTDGGYRFGIRFLAAMTRGSLDRMGVSGASYDAISLVAPDTVRIVDSTITDSGRRGLVISGGGSNCIIRDNHILNSNQSSGPYPGMDLGTAASAGVYANTCTGTLQTYGIVSAGNYCRVIGNRFSGTTAPTSISGTGVFAHHNQPTDDPESLPSDDTNYFPSGWT